jgi:hypothetical protein
VSVTAVPDTARAAGVVTVTVAQIRAVMRITQFARPWGVAIVISLSGRMV